MPESADTSSAVTRALEEVTTQLGQEHVSKAAVLKSLDSARLACAALLLSDFTLASSEKVEDRLWSAHLKANAYFRSELRQLKEGGNTKPVERRKSSNDYIKFIKFSQRFFRSYIRSLDHTYGGIAALHRLADRLGPDGDSSLDRNEAADANVDAAPDKDVLHSAYRTLIQLGDLSRYREAELAEQAPNWSFAVGYYDLARSIIPSSGVAFNQLAIVALGDENLFQATYYLYRSLSSPHRHPQAESNLRRAYSRIAHAWEKGELIENASALVAWHLRLLSKISHGKLFSEQRELEDEVASRLADALVKVSLEGTLRKLFLINFSACSFAQGQFANPDDAEGSVERYTYILQLCVRSVCVLLLAFRSQLQNLEKIQPGRTNALLRGPLVKTLPLLRLSMVWAIKNQPVLTNSVSPTIDQLQVDFWQLVAECLTLCLARCEVENLPESAYLLDEDAETIAFDPLLCEQTRSVWYANETRLKPFEYDMLNHQRDCNVESLSRLRFFLKTGIEFALGEATPLRYDIDLAEFRCEGGPIHNSDTQFNSKRCIPGTQAEKPLDSKGHLDLAPGFKRALDEDTEAERMVSSLVDPAQDIGLPLDVCTPTAAITGDFSRSSFPTGTHTADDLLAAVKNYSKRSTKAENPAHDAVGDASSLRQSVPLGPGQDSREFRRSIGHGSRPGSGRSGEVESGSIGPKTPDRGGNFKRSPAAGRPASHLSPDEDITLAGMPHTGHSRHISPVQLGNGSWSPRRLPGDFNQSGPTAVPPGKESSADLAQGQSWAPASTSDYGMGSSLLFGAGNSPWNVTAPGNQRMSATSPSLPASPSLRRDSGPPTSSNGPSSTWRNGHKAAG